MKRIVLGLLMICLAAGSVGTGTWAYLSDIETSPGNVFTAGTIPVIEVTIDIKPGSFPNSINPNSTGVIPVAILTTDDFDAATVDAETVRFGPAEAAAVHYALEDVDNDGDIDMILHFNTQDTGISPGDIEATLTGKTIDGTDIMGTDSVRTVPPFDSSDSDVGHSVQQTSDGGLVIVPVVFLIGFVIRDIFRRS